VPGVFVPDDFDPPASLVAGPFRLVPLGPEHSAADLAAWSGDIAHVRRTPGFAGRDWPPAEGMTAEANTADLTAHRDDFAGRRGFTYTVLAADAGTVIGCVYLSPAADERADVEVRSWVRGADAHLDVPLHDAVRDWLARDWPFRRPRSPGREPT
jgi:hypothetical protein